MNNAGKALIVIGLIAALAGAAAVFRPPGFGERDLSAFWVAARLLKTGGDPYDPVQMRSLWEQAQPGAPEVMVYKNPPWMLLFIRPLGRVGFSEAAGWLLLTNLVALVCAYRWLAPGRSRRLRLSFMTVLLSLSAVSTCLSLGQLPLIFLAALAAFLKLRTDPRRGAQFCSGALLAFTLVKPQLLFLCYLVWLADVIKRRAGWQLGGAVAAFALMALAPLRWQPRSYAWFAAARLPTY